MKEKASPWFRVLALCIAVGLGGTYVWRQQQKAAPQVEKPVERTVLSGSKSKVIAPTPLPVDQEETNQVLMPGSKTGVFRLTHELPKQRAVLPGSKSFVVVPAASPADDKKTNLPAKQQEPEVKERALLPSSKSIPMPIFRQRSVAPEDSPKPDKP